VGKVQATVLNPPASFIGQKEGLHVLADVAKLGLAFRIPASPPAEDFVFQLTTEESDSLRSHFVTLKTGRCGSYPPRHSVVLEFQASRESSTARESQSGQCFPRTSEHRNHSAT
jgi:hypothetical protein